MRQVWQGKYSKVKPGQDRGGRIRREGKEGVEDQHAQEEGLVRESRPDRLGRKDKQGGQNRGDTKVET